MTRFGCWAVAVSGLLCATAVAAKSSKHVIAATPWLLQVEQTPKQPRAGEPVRIAARVRPDVTAVTLQYQLVEPGAYLELKDPAFARHWTPVPMTPGTNTADARTCLAVLPGSLQKHRGLVRYRLTAVDADGRRLVAPGAHDTPPNYAYFVYDGIPAWTGAINSQSRDPELAARVTFSPEAMSRVQTYYLLAKKSSVENATWWDQAWGKEYKYTGTLVVEGEVFDHVGFRARGGVWRYAMGKNMWKFDLAGHGGLRARDDFGQPYPVPWNKVNLRACIQQGDYGHRGEQGMFESVGFRLFNLAGVPAPHTHWIQLRIIDEAQESAGQPVSRRFLGALPGHRERGRTFSQGARPAERQPLQNGRRHRRLEAPRRRRRHQPVRPRPLRGGLLARQPARRLVAGASRSAGLLQLPRHLRVHPPL